ncbi:hypothetical protein [Actinoplanes subtropicus]|uniref:hypothetical protein n=1 Tax=Actinoplanes subtropicus TaxID=543632 RepID=UPI000B340E69|nr:hypothetical protein [Actinoplanes subtropicus]
MGLAHVVVLSAVLLTLLCVSCAVVAVVNGDEMVLGRFRRDGRALRRLDRALRSDGPVPVVLGTPSIEQIACDLRRLGRQRRGGPTQLSEKWRAAVLSAYDVRLCLACQCLGVSEHLEPLEGMDRDLERLRVESELQAAGLVLR